MKVLYVENMLLGHHMPYITTLSSNSSYESLIITPEQIPGINAKQIIFPKMDFNSKKFRDYKECIYFIKQVALDEQVDIVHFVDGDKIMRYFGACMNTISEYCPVVITYHHFFGGILRKISYKKMLERRSAVVHTSQFVTLLEDYGIKDITHIEYPCFLPVSDEKKYRDIRVIGMFGDTRYDKGLDILLAALNYVKNPFKLIIAGKENDFSREEIEEWCKGYRDKVQIDLRFLSDFELKKYWEQTDLVVLPYRKIFDGASGQLTEGVNRGLPIIGPEHGSLGNIITNNHIGITYRTENVKDLAKAIDNILANGFVYDDVAHRYQKYMKPERFAMDYLHLYERLLKK